MRTTDVMYICDLHIFSCYNEKYKLKLILRVCLETGMQVYAFNSGAWKAEVGGF